MKTFRQFITETQEKKKKQSNGYHVGHAVFGSHSIPYHERLADSVREEYSILSAKSSEEKEAHLEKHYKIDKEDKKPISNYSLQSYDLNQSLIHKHLHPDDHWHAADHERMHGPLVSAMDKTLSKHKTPEDMHVYTGAGFSPERFKEKDHKPDQHIKVHLPAYTSTSLHQSQAEVFAKKDPVEHKGEYSDHQHMLKIHVPKGSGGLYLGSRSQFPQEKEFVLPRDSKVHVHPKPDIHQPLGVGKKPIAIWHAHLVHGE